MTQFHKKSKSKLWCFGALNCFAIGESLRKQALAKNFNLFIREKESQVQDL